MMKTYGKCVLVFLALFSYRAFAADCQPSLPKVLETSIYSEKTQGWNVVSLEDLPQDDKQLWEENHSGLCPGIAEGRFTANDTVSYAAALIKQISNEKYLEKLVVFSLTKSGISKVTLVKPVAVVIPFVVWKLPSGKYSGVGGRPTVKLSNESFVYEKMEAVATQYYFSGGAFHALTTAD